MDDLASKLVLGGLGGLIVWNPLSEERKEKILKVLDDIGTAIAVSEERKRAALPSRPPQEILALPTTTLSLAHENPSSIAYPSEATVAPSRDVGLSLFTPDPDSRWRRIIVPARTTWPS